MKQTAPNTVTCSHETLGKYTFVFDVNSESEIPELLFTENETNTAVGIGIRYKLNVRAR